jgi:Integrase core domain
MRSSSCAKQLAQAGHDAGAETIAWHLRQQGGGSPSVATIWRVLARRGFVVTPQPHKRPRSSWRRFAAELPNECWQADITHWQLADGRPVEILNILDDHSRLLTGSTARAVFKAGDVVADLHLAIARHGRPERLLTDIQRRGLHRPLPRPRLGRPGTRSNRPRHRLDPLQALPPHHLRQSRTAAPNPEELPRPATPRRHHQPTTTAAGHLHRLLQPPPAAPRRQAANPSRRLGGPATSHPRRQGIHISEHFRVRKDRIDSNGKLSLRHNSRLHHIGIGRDHAGTRVLMLIRDLDIRIITEDTGELLRELTLDPNRDYQPTGRDRYTRWRQ